VRAAAFGAAINIMRRSLASGETLRQCARLAKSDSETIVEIFERLGFIQGGRWWHFDSHSA
jgi:hypothetical protein